VVTDEVVEPPIRAFCRSCSAVERAFFVCSDQVFSVRFEHGEVLVAEGGAFYLLVLDRYIELCTATHRFDV